MKKFWPIIVIVILVLIVGGFYYSQYVRVLPNSAKTYYKIFNKNEILSGNEDNATIVDEKLDARLKKYHKTFAQIAGTTDEKKLKALFYMNFVHMSAYYGQRDLQDLSLKELLWGGDFFQCGNYSVLLGMLLEKAGYEFRTLAIYPGHSIIEIKLDDRWQVFDPTTNLWIDQSIEDQIAGKAKNIKEFFLQAEDQNNSKAREHMADLKIKVNVIDLKNNFMKKIVPEGPVRVGQYDYIKFSDYKY